MDQVEGKVVVITGAASGIGRAMARTFGKAGMRVAMADVESAALEEARREVAAHEIEVVATVCDVSQADSVAGLAEEVHSAFGGVHVVCNNAGVFCGGTTWGTSLNDYEWILNVNVWGVIHGIRCLFSKLDRAGIIELFPSASDGSTIDDSPNPDVESVWY